MKQQNNTEQKPLQDGMNVYHKILRGHLIVRNDEKGPAYGGKDFADNEISLSYAITEMEAGNLEIVEPLQDKGNGHTPGEAKCFEDKATGELYIMVGLTHLLTLSTNSHFKANAARIVLAWNLHDTFKNALQTVSDHWRGTGETYMSPGQKKAIQAVYDALIELQKASK